MWEPTEDPTTFITARIGNVVDYQNTDGVRWRIAGACNACGACEEPPTVVDGEPVEFVNVRRLGDGSDETWVRVLRWHDVPGVPGACSEDGFAARLDIPMTPDALRPDAGCSMTGEWL